ncbi:MAG: hypothetical protein R6U35_06830 [Candidatus Humimicrobiaceae bacterium]
MTAEQDINIILDEAEERISEIPEDNQAEKLSEYVSAFKGCMVLLSKKVDENSDYIIEIYKEISKIKDKI